MRQWTVITSLPGETQQLGKFLGEAVTGSTVILLSGELGAGKTCFTQGIARGLAISAREPVVSPSYTLMNHYHGRFDLYHFDLYRLSHSEELVDLGFDEYAHGEGVTVVEWAERIPDQNLEGLYVRLTYGGDDNRTLEFEARGKDYEDLLERFACLWEERGKAI